MIKQLIDIINCLIRMSQVNHYLQYILSNIDSPFMLFYGIVLLLLIVYSSIISSSYRTFLDSLLGRIIGLGIVYGTIQLCGWVYGILIALAFLLIISGASRNNYFSKEGFDGGGSISSKKTIGNRWFVEKVLGEIPLQIESDKVITQSINSS